MHRRSTPLAALGLLAMLVGPSAAQGPAPKGNVGQFFTVAEPIDTETIKQLQDTAAPLIERLSARGADRPILVFEFKPTEGPVATSFGAASDLQDFLLKRLRGAKQTVAFVPQPLSGYAVLAALACDEIVLGPKATLGPISPEGQAPTAREREAVRALAAAKGRDADLLLGMLDPDADLREIRTVEGQTAFVLAANLAEYKKTHAVDSEKPAWEGGRRGILTAERARGLFAKLQAETRAEVAEAYRLPGTTDDPTLGGTINAVLIRVDKPIDQVMESYLKRRIAQARAEKVNLIVFDMDCPGGLNHPADLIAEAVAGLKDIKTIAYINDRAVGLSALLALACDEIVFRKGGTLGDGSKLFDGGTAMDVDEALAQGLAQKADRLAELKGRPRAVARGLFDPRVVVSSARDSKIAQVVTVTDEDIRANPGRYEVLEVIKPEGKTLTVAAESAAALGLSTQKVVKDLDELKVIFGIKGNLRVDGPTWVDSLVSLLNNPAMSFFLLFVGLFMLVLELKLPGVGLPGICSALAFLLFFWSKYLGGTADQLEILLFLVGLICLAMELFVFPGFGVFGMSGILLILGSVIMASHTFIWPSEEYEYKQMGQTLMSATGLIVCVTAGAIVLGRYFPSLPLFNRMVLKPEVYVEGEPGEGKPGPDTESTFFYLLGEVGRTTSVLRPAGKARFGDLLVDVSTDGSYIPADSAVEVVEVRGQRVVVKKA